MLQTYSKFVEFAKRPPEQQPEIAQLESEFKHAPLAGSSFLKHLVYGPAGDRPASQFAHLISATTKYLALSRSAATALAVERYRLAHKEWPSDLAAQRHTTSRKFRSTPTTANLSAIDERSMAW